MHLPRSIVLVSGGMDSCVTASIASETTLPAFLHVNYGQRTQERELKAFHEIAEYYNVKDKLIVDIGYLAAIGGTSLIDTNMEIPENKLSENEVPNTYVPFRNGNILSIAVSWAEVIGASKIYIGAVEEDGSGYPDCRRTFLDAFEKSANLGTAVKEPFQILTPLIKLTKKEIVLLGKEKNAPVHLSWSCYQASEKSCGKCDSCLLRLRGFQQAGLKDPIPYE